MLMYFHDPMGNTIFINDASRKKSSVKRKKEIRNKVLKKYESEKREHNDLIRSCISNAWLEEFKKDDIVSLAIQQDKKISTIIKELEKQCYVKM